MTTATAFASSVPITANRTKRWQVLFGAILVQLILGTVYGYSVFWQPLEARLWPPVLTEETAARLRDQGSALPVGATVVADEAAARKLHDTRSGYLKYAFAICLLSFATAMVFAGRLQDLRGPRFTASLGGVILGTGFLLAGAMERLLVFYICHALLMGSVLVIVLLLFDTLFRGVERRDYPILRYVPFGITTVVIVAGVTLGNQYVGGDTEDRLFLLLGSIGLLAGVGIGYAYVCPIAALVKWFPQHKGLVSGVAVAGFGLGSYIFSQRSWFGAVGFIEEYGITTFFTVHGLISMVIVLGAAQFLRNPPTAPAIRSGNTSGITATAEATWQDVLKTGRFYLVWLMFFSGAMSGLMVIGILKPFAGSQLVTAAQAAGGALSDTAMTELLHKGAVAVGILAIFNAAGRVVWGLVSDRVGRTAAMTLMFALQCVTMLSLTLCDTEQLLAVGAALVGFNFGGNFAMFPSLTADLFGSKNFGANYGWVFTAYGVAGAIGVWVGNTAHAMTGSYFAAFAIAAALCLASAVLTVVLAVARRRAST
jgi:MFS transporter, OFA family, oxalate/formate antiporter